jgi:hypothetical protein
MRGSIPLNFNSFKHYITLFFPFMSFLSWFSSMFFFKKMVLINVFNEGVLLQCTPLNLSTLREEGHDGLVILLLNKTQHINTRRYVFPIVSNTSSPFSRRLKPPTRLCFPSTTSHRMRLAPPPSCLHRPRLARRRPWPSRRAAMAEHLTGHTCPSTDILWLPNSPSRSLMH